MFISAVLAWQALARIVDEFAMLAIEHVQRVVRVKTVVYGVFVEVTAQPFRRVANRRWILQSREDFSLQSRRYSFVYFQHEHPVITGKLNHLVFRHSETQPTLMRDAGTELFCDVARFTSRDTIHRQHLIGETDAVCGISTNFSSFSALMTIDSLIIRFELPCKICPHYQ